MCIGVCVSVQISLVPRPLPPGEWPGDEAMYKYVCVWCVCGVCVYGWVWREGKECYGESQLAHQFNIRFILTVNTSTSKFHPLGLAVSWDHLENNPLVTSTKTKSFVLCMFMTPWLQVKWSVTIPTSTEVHPHILYIT